MRVLWIGDSLIQSGFAVVTHQICDRISTKCDLVVYGIGYSGAVRNTHDYYIYPASTGDLYGLKRVVDIVSKERPDVIVIFNDDHIVKMFLDALVDVNYGRSVLLFPVNFLPLSKDNIMSFYNKEYKVSKVLTYTDVSKNKVLEINPNLSVDSIYHGVCSRTFHLINGAKKSMGLNDIFVVGNINSNTFRKRLDLFIKGFSMFAKNKGDVRCLIHTSTLNNAYDIKSLAKKCGIVDKLILSKNNLALQDMNLLYNLLDVNVCTSLGEGFGLSLIEGSASGVPILCPPLFNLVDIWGDAAHYVKLNKYTETIPDTDFEGEVIDIEDFAMCLEKFYTDTRYRLTKGNEVFKCSNNIKFNWDTVADKVFDAIVYAHKDKVSVLSG